KQERLVHSNIQAAVIRQTHGVAVRAQEQCLSLFLPEARYRGSAAIAPLAAQIDGGAQTIASKGRQRLALIEVADEPELILAVGIRGSHIAVRNPSSKPVCAPALDRDLRASGVPAQNIAIWQTVSCGGAVHQQWFIKAKWLIAILSVVDFRKDPGSRT